GSRVETRRRELEPLDLIKKNLRECGDGSGSVGEKAPQPLVQAAQNVVPVAVTAGDKIEGLRQWASGRCLSADRAGVYSRSEGGSGGRVRRVVRAD
ncbi:MAG: hypothetical protein ACKO9H_16485, partial [Planctomycetota bacterium]